MHPIPIRLVQFHHRHAIAARAGAGIVDEDIEAAEGCDQLVDHRLHLRGVANIGDEANRPPAQRFDFADDLRQAAPTGPWG